MSISLSLNFTNSELYIRWYLYSHWRI